MHRKTIRATHDEAREARNGCEFRTIANNTPLVHLGPDGIRLGFHTTCVVAHRPDGGLVLDPRDDGRQLGQLQRAGECLPRSGPAQ